MTGNNQISDDEKRYTGDNSKMKTLIVYYSMEGNTVELTVGTALGGALYSSGTIT